MSKSIRLPDGARVCACGRPLPRPRQRVCSNCQDESARQYQAIAHLRLIPSRVRRAVLDRDGMVCRHCGCVVIVMERQLGQGERLPRNLLSFDHFPTPFSRGGLGTVENIVVACLRCNVARGDRF